MPVPSLRLRPEERKLFEQLPAKLREGWNVAEEKLDTYERPEELKMRFLMFRLEDRKVLQTLSQVKEWKDAREVERIFRTLEKIPKDGLLEIFFTLGARGLSPLIAALLGSAKTDTDLQGIAELIAVRHALLESNAAPATITS